MNETDENVRVAEFMLDYARLVRFEKNAKDFIVACNFYRVFDMTVQTPKGENVSALVWARKLGLL